MLIRMSDTTYRGCGFFGLALLFFTLSFFLFFFFFCSFLLLFFFTVFPQGYALVDSISSNKVAEKELWFIRHFFYFHYTLKLDQSLGGTVHGRVDSMSYPFKRLSFSPVIP